MAIQIRRGTNAGWEASKSNIVVGEPAVTTDTERAFIGTGSGLYMELANLARVAPVYDPTAEYNVGDIVSWQGEIYKAIAPTSGAFNVAYWEKMTFAEILQDFREHMYDGYETATIEDVEIASFDNGASGIAVKDLQVDIEATQDLHGYSHPWAGGAGKNKIKYLLGTQTKNGVTFTVNADQTLKINGTATAGTSFDFGRVEIDTTKTYLFTGNPAGTSSSTWRTEVVWYDSNGSLLSTRYLNYEMAYDFSLSSETLPSNAAYAIIRFYVFDGKSPSNLEYKPMMRLNDTDDTWMPPANICPINGFDEVVVNVRGKNLLNYDAWKTMPVQRGVAVWENYGVTLAATERDCYTTYGNDFPNIDVKAGHTYTLSWESDLSASGRQFIFLYDANGTNTRLLYSDNNNQQLIFTVEDGEVFARLRFGVNYSGDTIAYKNIMVRESGDSTFEPYNGNTYTIDLDGTRYGGTLDVTTGVLTVTHGYVDFGSIDWSYLATYQVFRGQISGCILPAIGSNHIPISSAYKGRTPYYVTGLENGDIMYNSSGNNAGVFVKNTAYTDETAFKTAMAGQTIMYELATPQTVQLSAQEVETVFKNNNVWANSGDIKVLVYRMTRH